MERPFKDRRPVGPFMESRGASNEREFYQERFTQRMVSASKAGVQNPLEEINYFEETIQNVPWQNFNSKERVSIATPAISSIKTVFQISSEKGHISERTATSIVTQFSMILFDKVAGIEEDSLASSGLQLIKMDVKGDLD